MVLAGRAAAHSRYAGMPFWAEGDQCAPAATDILLGYHSEEGWTAAIHLLTGHYGIEVEVCLRIGPVSALEAPGMHQGCSGSAWSITVATTRLCRRRNALQYCL